jgi:hypothetical protein
LESARNQLEVVAMDSITVSATRPELTDQIKACLDLYTKHHDLYMKAISLSLAILGAVSGYMYSSQVLPGSRPALSAFLAFTSTMMSIGSCIYFVWVREIDALCRHLTAELGLRPYPFSVTLNSTRLFIGGHALMVVVFGANAVHPFF